MGRWRLSLIRPPLEGSAPAGSGFMLQEILLFFTVSHCSSNRNGSGSSSLCLVSEGAAQSWVLAASCGFKQYRTVVNSSEAGAARSPAKHALSADTSQMHMANDLVHRNI